MLSMFNTIPLQFCKTFLIEISSKWLAEQFTRVNGIFLVPNFWTPIAYLSNFSPSHSVLHPLAFHRHSVRAPPHIVS